MMGMNPMMQGQFMGMPSPNGVQMQMSQLRQSHPTSSPVLSQLDKKRKEEKK